LLVIVALALVAALILGRSWLFRRAGVDIEQSGANAAEVSRLTSGQLLALGLLLLPSILFLLWLVVYVLAGAILTAIGGSPTTS
jgi:hypothetical protein